MSQRWLALLGKVVVGARMEIILVVLCAVLAHQVPVFLTPQNLFNVLRSISMQAIIAFGMTLVIIVREIDLSVGAHAAFSGCLMAWLTARGVPIPAGAGITLLAGGAIGMFTGLMRSKPRSRRSSPPWRCSRPSAARR